MHLQKEKNGMVPLVVTQQVPLAYYTPQLVQEAWAPPEVKREGFLGGKLISVGFAIRQEREVKQIGPPQGRKGNAQELNNYNN